MKEFFAAASGAQESISRHMPAPVQDKTEPKLTIQQRKVVTPTAAECMANPRARSAKLRTAVRTPFF
ncbi:MAG TPA: 16S rRNA (cytosine(1402)-N(4))-methyltransferase, partial [Rhodospirillaceae bacterium]|nr:16S rRNA (cytosine(1402)-N(4))-methyltransferase [Rhodospirillaceae bacterium]